MIGSDVRSLTTPEIRAANEVEQIHREMAEGLAELDATSAAMTELQKQIEPFLTQSSELAKRSIEARMKISNAEARLRDVLRKRGQS